ncbi:MAG: tRNA pseudouridine synthase b [Benjaminiella poitrasii]|nr:MAG: tRNA pseudouridine synthase b [Benjaminiella poitrasii]
MSSLGSLRYTVNNVFAVYKPKGWTSRRVTDAVQLELSKEIWRKGHPDQPVPYLKRKDLVKIGHGGTLDPIAEGVLVIGVGHGCKQLSQFLRCTKEYIVTAKFGQETDTYDTEGKVTKTCPTDHLSRQLIQDTFPQFKGFINQMPPIYSAIRVQGKRLYNYARNNQSLPEPIKARQVLIEEIELLDFHQDWCQLRVTCGGGTYMRSLVHDMAMQMQTCAHMTALQRTRQAQFTLEHAYALDNLIVA